MGNTSKDNMALEQFIESPPAESPLGKLFIALIEENEWSKQYTVYASFGDESYLNIEHPGFLPDRPLIIRGKVVDELFSVRRVEDIVRNHLKEAGESIHLSISILSRKIDNINEAFNRIDEDKARAAIIIAFPEAEAVALKTIPQSHGGLYSLGINTENRTFVARKIDGEFTGGVARIKLPVLAWCCLEEGISYYQKHGVFWIALARAFVARELQISENEIHSASIFANNDCSLPSRPSIEKIVLRKNNTTIVVEFDNELPVKATFC